MGSRNPPHKSDRFLGTHADEAPAGCYIICISSFQLFFSVLIHSTHFTVECERQMFCQIRIATACAAPALQCSIGTLIVNERNFLLLSLFKKKADGCTTPEPPYLVFLQKHNCWKGASKLILVVHNRADGCKSLL